jgi:hypothetical protein
MGAAPRSTERGVLIAGAITFLFWCLSLAIPAFMRPAPMLFNVGTLFLGFIVTMGWLLTACLLAWSRQWRPALLAAIFFIVPTVRSTTPSWGVDYVLAEAAQRLEFAFHRSSYDGLVVGTPKGEAPRYVRVSRRQTDDWKPRVEEIWFDEADELGSADDSVRRARFEASHPKPSDERRPPLYVIRPLGGHYYFIDVRNWLRDTD